MICPDLARFWRIPLAGAREGLDLATSGRDPSGLGVGWVELCGRMSACVERSNVGGERVHVPARIRPDLARFWRIPLAVAREGLDLATSGRDPSGFGGRGGRVVST